MPTKRGPEPVQIEPPVRDAWLRTATPRGPWTWAELKRQFRAFLPAAQSKTLCATLQQWGASPDALQPLLRMIRAIVVSNAVHRAEMKRGKWAAGTARDPHYEGTPEEPGALRPLLDIVERVISDLERLIQWKFTPPIVLQELDAKHKPTRRRAHLSRLDEAIRETFEKPGRSSWGCARVCARTRNVPEAERRHSCSPTGYRLAPCPRPDRKPLADVIW